MKKRSLIVIIVVVIFVLIALGLYYYFNKTPSTKPDSNDNLINNWEDALNLDITSNIEFIEQVQKYSSMNLSENETRALNLTIKAEEYLLYPDYFRFPKQEDIDKLKIINGKKAIPYNHGTSDCENIWEMFFSYHLGSANFRNEIRDIIKKCNDDYVYIHSSKYGPKPEDETSKSYGVYLIQLSSEDIENIKK